MAQTDLKSIVEKIPASVTWLGARQVREQASLFAVKDSNIEAHQTSDSIGVYFEALVDGQFGYAATSSMNAEGLQEAANRAIENATRAAKYKVFSFTKDQRPAVKGTYASPVAQSFSSHYPKEIFSELQSLTDAMKVSSKIGRRIGRVQQIEVESKFLSSNGTDVSQKQSLVSTHLEAIAQDGPVVQRRTDGGFSARSRQGGMELWWGTSMRERAKRLADEAIELLSAEDCPTEKLDLILMPDQMMLQIHESIGHPLELDRILGDERNYAGWSFVQPQDFGTLQYGSELMNVTFDPTVQSEFASYSFDDIGNPATRTFLIEKGLLKRGLGSLESQTRSKLPGVANQRASSWNRPPIDRMANLNLEPGSSSLKDLISQVEDGVLMDSNRSWSIDDRRNKFQFGCERGQRIINGKITKLLKNPNYRGVTVPFWNSLKAVGDRSTLEIFGSPYCGKGEPNQIIRVGHASPACLFSKVEVFGGGQS